jgi:hypothetical protein
MPAPSEPVFAPDEAHPPPSHPRRQGMSQPTPPPPPPPGRRSFWRNPTVIGIATVIGAVAAVLAVPALNLGAAHGDPPSSSPSINVGGDVGGCIQTGGTNPTCTVEQQIDEATKNSSDAKRLKDLVESFSIREPQGPAPWSYLIYNTKDSTGREVGLKVKSKPTLDGQQIGSISGRSIAWAECHIVNDFNPEQGSDVDLGPKWLRIYWPSHSPTTSFLTSSKSDSSRGYVYAGYALPFNHNGNIPSC